MKRTSGTSNEEKPRSLYSTEYRTNTLPPPLAPHVELASTYARQFATSKSRAQVYQGTSEYQTYTHGPTVVTSARTASLVDPHVYRDWLIFEERLKQNHRRLQRKRRNYLGQIAAFVTLALYFAWFGVAGHKRYRLICRILCGVSAYCAFLIIRNRKFLQALKYTAQCNRVLHQFRMRFETSVHDKPGAEGDRPNTNVPSSFLSDSRVAFFPTVPRHLRDGYSDFKLTYHRKREAAKRRQAERSRRDKQRTKSDFKLSEKRPRRRLVKQAGIYAALECATDEGSSSSVVHDARARVAAIAGGGIYSIIDPVTNSESEVVEPAEGGRLSRSSSTLWKSS